MPAKPKTIDDFARVSATERAALEKLRRDIKAAAPAAEECISYDIPGYRLGSRLLVSFGAAKNHCAFYPGAHPIRDPNRLSHGMARPGVCSPARNDELRQCDLS
jgi:uncharacterized protein YdhG (YjbR/CyaY superfamily)